MARRNLHRACRVTERACWVLACVSIAMYVAARTDTAVSGSAALARVSLNQAAVYPATASPAAASPATVNPGAGDVAPNITTADPLGSLQIPSLDLHTALYSDTSELNLNRGAGLIRGMAAPGEGGNLGVAAHRDGIFRPLEKIEVGAAIEVRTVDSLYVYRVSSITVVDRTDSALLRRTDEPAITLVTCYPFRFVGPAPRRFVVRGRLDSVRGSRATHDKALGKALGKTVGEALGEALEKTAAI